MKIMMKKQLQLIATLFLFLPAGAFPQVEFNHPEQWVVNLAEQRDQKLTLRTLPDTKETGLNLSWNGYTFPYAELHLHTPLQLPESFRKGSLALRIQLPGDAPIRCISLRLQDASGEVFQYQMRCLPPRETRIITANYQINLQEKKASSWGGNNDKKFDFPVALKGFSIDFSPESGVGEALFLGAELIPDTPGISAADGIEFEVETGSSLRILRPGKQEKLSLCFRNLNSSAFDGYAEVEFENFFGRTFTEKIGTLKLGPKEQRTFPVTTPLPTLGHWTVRAKLKRDGKQPGELTRTFTCFEPAGPTPGRARGFLWGISSHPQLHPARDQKLEALAAALVGAKVVREDVSWRRVQPARDQWNFRSFDQTVAIFAEQGIELQAILCYCAPWAARDPAAQRPDKAEPEPEAWKKFCFEMAKRYRGRIRFWEVWNEPDVTPFSAFDSASYAGMMRNAFAAIKAADPDAMVLTGGFATLAAHPMLREPGYQENALKLGRGSYDIHAYHEHGDFHPHYVKMVEERFLPMRKRAGVTEPWWANETALTSSGGNEKPQAMALYKKLLYAWSRGAIGYNWYDLRNDGDDPNHGEHNYGMMTRDFRPKPVYTVYNTLTSLFGGKEFLRQLDTDAREYLLLFRGEDELALAAWNEQGISRQAIIRTDAGAAELADLMNNRRPVEIREGRILLEVENLPATLLLKGATRAEFVGTPVGLESSAIAIPGKPYRFTATLLNPLDEAAEFFLKLQPPAGFAQSADELRILVPAGETTKLAREILVAPDFHPAFDNPYQLSVEYRISGSEITGKTVLNIRPAQIVKTGSPVGQEPDFKLEHRRQVRDLFAGDPTRGHLLWKGPQDHSARILLRTDEDHLLLHVDVTDDLHCQPEQGANTWMGDNVQFALELPNQNGGWEFGLTRLSDGSSESWCWSAPEGFLPENAARQIRLQTSRTEKVTAYDAKIPFSTVGLTREMLNHGFRFNLLVNDNDGEGRRGWIAIAPGIGERKDPSLFPFIIFN